MSEESHKRFRAQITDEALNRYREKNKALEEAERQVKNSKNSIIWLIFAGGVFIFFIFIVIILIFLLFFIQGNNNPNNEQKNIEWTEEGNKTKVAYGVAMQERCYNKFNNFIENYGQDYSKCLIEIDFNEQFCEGYNPQTQALSKENIIVILDASGSMLQKTSPVMGISEVRIDVVKKAVLNFFNKMPEGVNTGLIVYGHKGSNSTIDKELSCNGIEEVIKLGQNDYSKIISAMNSFTPKGWTPLANSLNFAKDILKEKANGGKNYLILLTDGIESCDGDPLKAAENLKLEIPGIKLIVIGFGIYDQDQINLRKIADIGGGSYINAESSSDIANAFNDQLLLIKKECITGEIQKMSLKLKENNLSNLNCWLEATEKEKENFVSNIEKKSNDYVCNVEILEAIKARSEEFWLKKVEIEEKNSSIFNQKKTEYEKQLLELNKR